MNERLASGRRKRKGGTAVKEYDLAVGNSGLFDAGTLPGRDSLRWSRFFLLPEKSSGRVGGDQNGMENETDKVYQILSSETKIINKKKLIKNCEVYQQSN